MNGMEFTYNWSTYLHNSSSESSFMKDHESFQSMYLYRLSLFSESRVKMSNRDYFNGLKDSHETEASSNFIVGLDGEIIQCVPTWEMAYASNSRNIDTVSIECCHPDETGKFTDETYRSLVQLTAWLCVKFNLTEDQVIRHYDVTGKNCPKYFVENEDAWAQFKEDVAGAFAKGS